MATTRPLYSSPYGDNIFGSFTEGAVLLGEHPQMDTALMAAGRARYRGQRRTGPEVVAA